MLFFSERQIQHGAGYEGRFEKAGRDSRTDENRCRQDDAAGGYTDSDSEDALKSIGLQVSAVLKENDAYHALRRSRIRENPPGISATDITGGFEKAYSVLIMLSLYLQHSKSEKTAADSVCRNPQTPRRSAKLFSAPSVLCSSTRIARTLPSCTPS